MILMFFESLKNHLVSFEVYTVLHLDFNFETSIDWSGALPCRMTHQSNKIFKRQPTFRLTFMSEDVDPFHYFGSLVNSSTKLKSCILISFTQFMYHATWIGHYSFYEPMGICDCQRFAEINLKISLQV